MRGDSSGWFALAAASPLQAPRHLTLSPRQPPAGWQQHRSRVRSPPVPAAPNLPPCSHTIKTFGALLFATVMTTRQFISILLSCILFAHPLSGGQWVGTVMVFGALYYKSLSKGGGHKGSAKDGVPAAGAADAEKLPLVHADATGAPIEGGAAAAEPLK